MPENPADVDRIPLPPGDSNTAGALTPAEETFTDAVRDGRLWGEPARRSVGTLAALLVAWVTYALCTGLADWNYYRVIRRVSIVELEPPEQGFQSISDPTQRLAALLGSLDADFQNPDSSLSGADLLSALKADGNLAYRFLVDGTAAIKSLESGSPTPSEEPAGSGVDEAWRSPAVEFAAALAQQIGAAAGSMDPVGTGGAAAERRLAAADQVAGSIAGIAGLAAALNSQARLEGCGDPNGESCASFHERWESGNMPPIFSFGFRRFLPIAPRDLHAVLLGSEEKSSDVASKLLKSMRVAPESGAGVEYEARMTFSLLDRVRAHRDVRNARLWITVWRGLEQLAMIGLFFWSLETLLARSLRRRKEDRAAEKLALEVNTAATRSAFLKMAPSRLGGVAQPASKPQSRAELHLVAGALPLIREWSKIQSPSDRVALLKDFFGEVKNAELGSRWILGWAARAIPAVGFVGTVHGIMFALRDAGSILAARGPVAQAAAVGGVTDQLGVAFTTTLIALLFGLVLSRIDDGQAQRELRLIEVIEERFAQVLRMP